ncbi:MAG: hypothetical protein ACFE0O_02220 [Opitutales bacterium]
MNATLSSVAPPPEPQGWSQLLATRPALNRAASLEPEGEQALLARVPVKPLPWLVPPLSWIIRPRSQRTLRIEGAGFEVLQLALSADRVGDLIDHFGERHGLTFHESRVAVTGYLQQLVKEGILVLLGDDHAA